MLQKHRAISWRVIVFGSTLKWNCIVEFNVVAFHVSKTWWRVYFLSKYNLLKCQNKNKFKTHWILCLDQSKITRLSYTTPTTLAAAPIKKTQKFRQESWKDSTLTKKKTKCFASFSGNGNNTYYSLKIGTNNFQTDSLKAYKASEGHRLWATVCALIF